MNMLYVATVKSFPPTTSIDRFICYFIRLMISVLFQDLENTASSDAGVRERIASLPPEVSEVSLLANLADRTAADQLSAAVNEAAALLADYNGRLQAEMEDRRRLLTMLRDYTLAQRQLLQQAQSTLEV